MNLNQLASYIAARRRELVDDIRGKAEDITLTDIIEKIDFKPTYMEYAEYKEGSVFNFLINEGHLDVRIDSKSIKLNSKESTILEFTGREAESIYKNMINGIEKERKEGGYDIPF